MESPCVYREMHDTPLLGAVDPLVAKRPYGALEACLVPRWQLDASLKASKRGANLSGDRVQHKHRHKPAGRSSKSQTDIATKSIYLGKCTEALHELVCLFVTDALWGFEEITSHENAELHKLRVVPSTKAWAMVVLQVGDDNFLANAGAAVELEEHARASIHEHVRVLADDSVYHALDCEVGKLGVGFVGGHDKRDPVLLEDVRERLDHLGRHIHRRLVCLACCVVQATGQASFCQFQLVLAGTERDS